MPDPIMSSPGPLVSPMEEPEVIEIEPVVITGSKTLSPLKQDLNAPFTAREAGTMALTCLSEIDAIAEGIISGFPCQCENGQWQIVKGLKIDDFSRARIDKSVAELQEEAAAVSELLGK